MSNICILSGRISDYGPKLRYLESGKPELALTLCCDEPSRDGRMFTVYVPVLVYGNQCESLAETLEAGDVVLVTGKLAWTKKTTKDGEKSGLAVTTFAVEVLSRLPQHETSPSYATASMSGGENVQSGGDTDVAPSKKGRPRYPKWKPEHRN
jgi:single-stranded DNA-binding protein